MAAGRSIKVEGKVEDDVVSVPRCWTRVMLAN
jgi:hypothetical protein